MANDREIFKRLCFGEKPDIPETLKPKIFSAKNPCTTCKPCSGEIAPEDFDIHVGYWTPIWFPIHAACVKAYRDSEVYECQLIDRNCNDCKYFKRGQTSEVVADVSRSFFPRIKTQVGFCEKNKAQVEATPCCFQGMGCFEHRKSQMEQV